MSERNVVIACCALLAAGVTTTFVTGAWQPSALGACACWLGGEYMIHRQERRGSR